METILLCLIALNLIYPIDTTLGPGSRKSPSRTTEKIVSPPSESFQFEPKIPEESLPPSDINVIQRDLLQEDITAQFILENYNSYCTTCVNAREFPNPTLIYITPWNNRGYDLVKIFPQKFDYISPVWFSLKRIGLEKYHIEGTHDIDVKWIETLRENRADVRIVPRVAFEKWSADDIQALFQSETEILQLGLTMKKLLIKYNHLFDGYMVEVLALFQGSSKANIHHVLIDLAGQIHDIETNTTQKKKEIFLAVPPLEEYFDRTDFEVLSEHLNGFHVMAYDFPTKQPGPVAPLGKKFLLIEHQTLLSGFRMDQRNHESISSCRKSQFSKSISWSKFLRLSLRSNSSISTGK